VSVYTLCSKVLVVELAQQFVIDEQDLYTRIKITDPACFGTCFTCDVFSKGLGMSYANGTFNTKVEASW